MAATAPIRLRYRFNHSSMQLAVYWEPRIGKNGKPGKSLVSHGLWYTPLRTCEQCGKVSTPKKVQQRSLCYGVLGYSGMLCTGCWNVIRLIAYAQDDAKFVKWAAGKIQREARKYGNEKRRAAGNADVGD
jgi:hypothetical protein